MADIIPYYEKHGSGYPLFLLHGNGENGSIFAKQTEFFSQRYTVFLPDTRGHGKSALGSEKFDFHTFADDLMTIFEREKIEKAHIVGFSDGGNIALTFAAKYPDRVSALVANGANLYPTGMKAKYYFPVIAGSFIASFRALFQEKYKREARMLGLMARHPHISKKELSRITAKTLVLVGSDDMIKPSHSRLIAFSISGSTLITLPGSHFLLGDDPESYNRTVTDFLIKAEKTD